MYVWVDALTNYITGAGFPDENAPALALLAGRRARHRQGHRALPRRLLAGVPDVGRHRAAQARVRPRLPLQPRGEDVEVGRQRGRSVRPGEGLRRRPGALLLPARGGVRPGRQLQPRGHRQPHQRRPGQRPGQPGAALAVDDRQELRRQDPGAGRVHGGGQGHPGGGRCALRHGARGHGPAGHQALPRCRVGRGGGRQPLLRRRGAVGQAQDRLRAHGDDPLRDGGGGAAGGDPGAAGDAGGRGQAARRPRAGTGGAHLQGAGRGGAAAPGTAIPPPTGVFPRYVEPGPKATSRRRRSRSRRRRRERFPLPVFTGEG